MKYTKYQQGESITLEGLKHHLRIVGDSNDAELVALLKAATQYVQEYFDKALVSCSVLQEQPQADTDFMLFLSDQTNIRVRDYKGNEVGFEQSGNCITLSQATSVRISYDCAPADDVEQYALIVYQVAAANYDGQPDMISKILSNYPVC